MSKNSDSALLFWTPDRMTKNIKFFIKLRDSFKHNNLMVGVLLAPAAFKAGSKVWVRYLGVIEGHPEGFAIRDGLWRPGGAFFQIGLGCVMSHHLSSHRRALHIPVLILAGNSKRIFFNTHLSKLALIRFQLHKSISCRTSPSKLA